MSNISKWFLFKDLIWDIINLHFGSKLPHFSDLKLHNSLTFQWLIPSLIYRVLKFDLRNRLWKVLHIKQALTRFGLISLEKSLVESMLWNQLETRVVKSWSNSWVTDETLLLSSPRTHTNMYRAVAGLFHGFVTEEMKRPFDRFGEHIILAKNPTPLHALVPLCHAHIMTFCFSRRPNIDRLSSHDITTLY